MACYVSFRQSFFGLQRPEGQASSLFFISQPWSKGLPLLLSGMDDFAQARPEVLEERQARPIELADGFFYNKVSSGRGSAEAASDPSLVLCVEARLAGLPDLLNYKDGYT